MKEKERLLEVYACIASPDQASCLFALCLLSCADLRVRGPTKHTPDTHSQGAEALLPLSNQCLVSMPPCPKVSSVQRSKVSSVQRSKVSSAQRYAQHYFGLLATVQWEYLSTMLDGMLCSFDSMSTGCIQFNSDDGSVKPLPPLANFNLAALVNDQVEYFCYYS